MKSQDKKTYLQTTRLLKPACCTISRGGGGWGVGRSFNKIETFLYYGVRPVISKAFFSYPK
jgi:hypothetical protein